MSLILCMACCGTMADEPPCLRLALLFPKTKRAEKMRAPIIQGQRDIPQPHAMDTTPPHTTLSAQAHAHMAVLPPPHRRRLPEGGHDVVGELHILEHPLQLGGEGGP